MKLAIMQPYFFPSLSHFALINSIDKWVVFDVTQYTPKSWMSRNRILHPTEGWQYINVALEKASISIKTSQAIIKNKEDTQNALLGKLTHYKRYAPHYREVVVLVKDIFSRVNDDSLVSFNVSGLEAICDYLGIPFNYSICSQFELSFPEVMGPGDWAPFIAKELGASEYINPEGGRGLFKLIDFSKNNIQLSFLTFKDKPYAVGKYQYESMLSILDVLMWNSVDDIKRAMTNQSQVFTV